jgi:predicted dehydrogenase
MSVTSTPVPIRVALIGAGAIAVHSAKALLAIPGVTIPVVCDTSLARATELAATTGGRAVTIPAEVFAANDVDAVTIAVPNAFHASLAIAALEAGKHVFLDKPFALNAAEAERVIAVAARSGKVFCLGMNQRFAEPARRMKALVDSGRLGEVYHLKAFWQRRWGIPKLGTWFGQKALAGGGGLLDIGVHMLDLGLYTINDFAASAVLGATYTKFGNRGLGEGGWGKSDAKQDTVFDVDDFASAFIRLKSGRSLTLDATWAAMQETDARHGIQVFGSEGGAILENNQVRLVTRSAAGEWVTTQSPDVGVLPFAHGCRFRNAINHLRGEEPLATTAEQALAVQRILDGIYASSATAATIAIAS